MTPDRETIAPLARRVCTAAESRTGGLCTWRLDEQEPAVLSFRLEAEGKVVGAACGMVALRDIRDPKIIEKDMLRILLRQLAITPDPRESTTDEQC